MLSVLSRPRRLPVLANQRHLLLLLLHLLLLLWLRLLLLLLLRRRRRRRRRRRAALLLDLARHCTAIFRATFAAPAPGRHFPRLRLVLQSVFRAQFRVRV